MVNTTLLAGDVLLLQRGYEYLTTTNIQNTDESTRLVADLKAALDRFLPPTQPLPNPPSKGWSCPSCTGQIGFLVEALVSTTINVNTNNGMLLWGSERLTDTYYQPAVDILNADIVCLSCGKAIDLPESAYGSLAQSANKQEREFPSGTPKANHIFPAERATPEASPLAQFFRHGLSHHKPASNPYAPHTFQLSTSERDVLAHAREHGEHSHSINNLARASFAGKGTLEIVETAAPLLRRLTALLDTPPHTHASIAALRLEIAKRLEELFPTHPQREASLSALFSCTFCGGHLHVRRRGQECTCVVLDQSTGHLIWGGATLTNNYNGRPAFVVCDAEVACAVCSRRHPSLAYGYEQAEIVFTCAHCKEQKPLNHLERIQSQAGQIRPLMCAKCARSTP